MRTLIYQCYHPNTVGSKTENVGAYLPIDELAELSQRRIEDYARLINSDYIFRDKPAYTGITAHPAWTRFKCLDYAADYDQILYVDCDILPTEQLFASGNSVFTESGVGKLTEREEGSKESWHVNAGVFKLTKQEAFRLKGEIHKKPYIRMLEQTGKNQEQFNKAYYKATRRKPSVLDYRWNATRPYHRDGDYWLHHFIGHQKLSTGNSWGSLNTGGVHEWNLSQ